MKLLTQEQVDKLPIGTKVKIKWIGGKDWFAYTIKDKMGNCSCVKKFSPNSGWWTGQITFVGKESYHTQVSRIKGKEA